MPSREEIDTLLSGKVYGEPPKNAKSRRRVTIGSSLRHSESMEGERLNRARIAAERRAKAKTEERRRQLARNEAKAATQTPRRNSDDALKQNGLPKRERRGRTQSPGSEAKRLEEERKAREAEAKRLEERTQGTGSRSQTPRRRRKAREEELQHSAVLNSQTQY